MCSAAAARPVRPAVAQRPQRAPVPPLPVFDVLDQAHVAALDMLRTFQDLLDLLDAEGATDAARQRATQVLAYFNGPGRDHHQQEEQQVFPGLLVAGDPTIVQHVQRLQQDHGWIEEDWRELAPQVEAIAQGFAWYDLAMLRAALPVFTSLYHEHIALEESLIYPAAKRQLLERINGERDRAASAAG